MTTLNELAAMLDEATGPSREIDLEIERLTTGWPLRWCEHGVTYDRFGPGAIGNPVFTAPVEYTDSIDDALAPVERLLPKYKWETSMWHFDPPRRFHARLKEVHSNSNAHEAFAPTAPLAILKALVAALIAREEADHG